MSVFASPVLRSLLGLGALAVGLALAGCVSRPVMAPVEERAAPASSLPGRASRAPEPGAPVVSTPSGRPGSVVAPAPSATSPASAAAPVADPAEGPRPGHYIVRPGDTLGRIALDHGQSWRDLARWNGLDNPNLIEVGQQLRVVPPGTEPGAALARPVTPAGRVESRPLDGRATATGPGAAPAATAPSVATSQATVAAAPAVGPGASAAAPVARGPDEDVAWAWPAPGPLLSGFDEARQTKGLAIGGKAGDPVLAAADGRVVYAGAGLRGYGNLVIVKHNALFLSAYAHNQALLVKEDQVVRRGQKIAEMGSSESERVNLHFEIRRQGRPVDPARLLPAR